MSRPRIVVIGSLVFDFVARAPRLPRKGETILGDQFGMFPGGKGANQAVQAGRLGAEVYLVGRIGDDVLGERLLTSLKENGVATDFVRRDPAVKTAACCIHVDEQGNNSIIIVPESNLACSREDVDTAAEVIRAAGMMICQLEIALGTVNYAVEVAARQGVPVILNPAPAQSGLERLLAQVTYVTPNETEAEILTGLPASTGTSSESWESAVSRKLLALGPQAVILTVGERGAYLANHDGERLIPTFRVPVLDATAAGDAFTGALGVALAEGRKIEDAIRFANAAGALATTRVGAQPSLASRSEVEQLLAKTGEWGA
jgi:ribokinase